jgi:molecular chaperone GrpE (heat shock protein)
MNPNETDPHAMPNGAEPHNEAATPANDAGIDPIAQLEAEKTDLKVELTERDLLKTLERHGVKKLEPQGQRFDPNLHQAMFEVPNAEVPNGTVVQVVQSGYVIGDRVLRPALVGVSKGGPKAPATDTGAGAESAPNT